MNYVATRAFGGRSASVARFNGMPEAAVWAMTFLEFAEALAKVRAS